MRYVSCWPLYFQDIFSIPDPPMWMDNTARKQCQELEVAVGGPMVKRQYIFSLDMADSFVFFVFFF